MRLFYKHKPTKELFTVVTESSLDRLSLIDLATILKDFRTPKIKELMKEEIKQKMRHGKL